MRKNYFNKIIHYLLFAICINISTVHAQQWLGASNSSDPIFRTGKVGIGISTQPLNALDVFGQMSLRDGGDWAVIYKPDNPNTSFLFRRGTNTPNGYVDLLQITNKGQILMGMTNTAPIYSLRGGTLISNYLYTGVSSNPYYNQGSAIWGELTYGDSGTSPTGTVHGISSVVNVNSCGDEESEMAGLFVSLLANEPSRLWGIDLGVNGPVTKQANLLTGTVNAINNYNNSRPVNGSFGAVIISKPNAGAGNRGSSFPTFSIDAGLAIVGYSNTYISPQSDF